MYFADYLKFFIFLSTKSDLRQPKQIKMIRVFSTKRTFDKNNLYINIMFQHHQSNSVQHPQSLSLIFPHTIHSISHINLCQQFFLFHATYHQTIPLHIDIQFKTFIQINFYKKNQQAFQFNDNKLK
ncbi:hypothetical protein pb186bvf_015833 [Paramecium bursaria]